MITINTQILHHLSDGATDKEIGVILNLTKKAVERRIEKMRESLQARNTTHLVVLWIERGQPDDLFSGD